MLQQQNEFHSNDKSTTIKATEGWHGLCEIATLGAVVGGATAAAAHTLVKNNDFAQQCEVRLVGRQRQHN